MANILVTGDMGYIGSKLHERLEDDGHHVVGYDLKVHNDVRQIGSFVEWGRSHKFEYIFHLAAKPKNKNLSPAEMLSHNVFGTSAVLQFAHQIEVKRFIFSSSSALYGDGKGPTDHYGLHKLMSEMECKHYSLYHGLSTICLRYFNVYSSDRRLDGLHDSVIASFIDRLYENKDLVISGDGTIERDYIHLDDVIEANLVAMNCDIEHGEHLSTDIGTGKTHTINQIKEYILKLKPHAKFVYRPSEAQEPKVVCAFPSPQEYFPWCAKISLEEGLRRCFSNGGV